MARLVLSSTGTWGDFLPFIALGRRLRARGHHVRLAVNPTVVRTALEAGLDAVPCGRSYGEAVRRGGPAPAVGRDGRSRQLPRPARRVPGRRPADRLVAPAGGAAGPRAPG